MRAKCAAPLREAGAARRAAPPQFCGFELDGEGGANWPSLFANPLVYWRKPFSPMRRKRPPVMSPTAFLRFGSPGRTRTSDQAVNSPMTWERSCNVTKRLGRLIISYLFDLA